MEDNNNQMEINLDSAEIIPQTRKPYTFRYKVSKEIPLEKVKEIIWDNIRNIIRERGRLQATKSEDVAKVARWICGDYKPMLLLSGGCGNGKTTTAKAVQMMMQSMYCTSMQDSHGNLHIIGNVKQQGSVPQVTFITSNELRQIAINSYDDLCRIQKARFLIIDDIGMEPASTKYYGNELSPIADVLYYRYENMLFTIATSNLNREEIGQRYGARIDSRLAEVMDVVNFNSADFRK